MASSTSHKRFKYDVFLSFRGEDTRKNFVDHLYAALNQQGICTFKDDERLEEGKKINEELLQAIEDSRFYIIVFSKHYATSSWCLNEHLKIMECQKMEEHTPFPVFYDVEPTEVRKQSGPVEKSLVIHKNKSEIEIWREALREAANLLGWDLRKTADGHEARVVRKVVDYISLELRPINMNFKENLVCIEKRMQDFHHNLEIGANDVRMIGIKGIGGGGKTTLATSIFDQIFFHFESSIFVENVREASKPSLSCLKNLQEQILRGLLKDKIRMILAI